MLDRFKGYFNLTSGAINTLLGREKDPDTTPDVVEEELPEDTREDTQAEEEPSDTSDTDVETEEDEYVRRMRKDFHDVLTKGLL